MRSSRKTHVKVSVAFCFDRFNDLDYVSPADFRFHYDVIQTGTDQKKATNRMITFLYSFWGGKEDEKGHSDYCSADNDSVDL